MNNRSIFLEKYSESLRLGVYIGIPQEEEQKSLLLLFFLNVLLRIAEAHGEGKEDLKLAKNIQNWKN